MQMHSKRIIIVLALVWCALDGRAQFPVCDSLPIAYDHAGITFTTSSLGSFGDSMIVVPITNMHLTQGMAYPQAKLVPLTPLPPGMTLNTHWDTFASSWNPGQTMPAHFHFDVDAPIPQDGSVTFGIWANNLTPLLTDSCEFDSTFTIDLNPSGTGLLEATSQRSLTVWPVPANDRIHVLLPANAGAVKEIFFTEVTGTQIDLGWTCAGHQCIGEVGDVRPGMFMLACILEGGGMLKTRFVVAR